jgi:hypothetical protein
MLEWPLSHFLVAGYVGVLALLFIYHLGRTSELLVNVDLAHNKDMKNFYIQKIQYHSGQILRLPIWPVSFSRRIFQLLRWYAGR